MPHSYDKQNIFAKILRGEIPNETVLETEHSLAFKDIHPQAPVHVLVIPKGPYVCHDHFATDATDAEIVDFMRTTAQVCEMMDISPGQGFDGYRTLSNAGKAASQDVPHYHIHILGGRDLGPMLA